MKKEFEIRDILNAVNSITKIKGNKNNEINAKKEALTHNNQVKSNKSDILVLDQMIE